MIVDIFAGSSPVRSPRHAAALARASFICSKLTVSQILQPLGGFVRVHSSCTILAIDSLRRFVFLYRYSGPCRFVLHLSGISETIRQKFGYWTRPSLCMHGHALAVTWSVKRTCCSKLCCHQLHGKS